MSFDTIEKSNFDAQPVALYEFYRVSKNDVTNYWRYTSADKDHIVQGSTYKAVAISDGGITATSDPTAAQFVVTMPTGEDVPQMYQGVSLIPSDSMWLNLWRYYPEDGARILIWKGTVSGVIQQDALTSQVTCGTLAASFDRDGLRLAWTRGCPYATYGVSCHVNPDDFTTEFTIDSLSGNQINATELGTQVDDWFTGGYIEWTLENGSTERREITDHAGVTITLSGITFGLTVGQTLKAIAGDDRTRQTCNDKFNNLVWYGGFDLPGKSPFDGDPVF